MPGYWKIFDSCWLECVRISNLGRGGDPAGPGQSERASLVNGTMLHPALSNTESLFQLSYHLSRDIGLCFQWLTGFTHMLWLVLGGWRELKRGGMKSNLGCWVEGTGLCGGNGVEKESDQETVGGGWCVLRESTWASRQELVDACEPITDWPGPIHPTPPSAQVAQYWTQYSPLEIKSPLLLANANKLRYD
jgi:hypothetical protein